MEADFRRDYGISLMEQIDGMSWREFVSLARNLSPFGAVATRAMEMREAGRAGDDRADAAAFFETMRAGR